MPSDARPGERDPLDAEEAEPVDQAAIPSWPAIKSAGHRNDADPRLPRP